MSVKISSIEKDVFKILKTIAILFSVFNTLVVFSQTDNAKKGVVSYGQLESTGMGGPVGLDYNAVLVFNDKASLYIVRNDSLEKAHIYENVTVNTQDMGFILTKATNAYGMRHFVDLKKDSMYSRDIGFDYVAEERPKIEWKIEQEQKKIGDFTCTKAVTTFRGREFIAWFTTQIPLPFGPWKLQGLPGLILEAHDPKKEVYFYFKNLSYPSDTNVKVSKPVIQKEQSWKKWITFEEYKIYMIESYLNSQMNGRMISEQVDVSTAQMDAYKYDMSNSYIENFDVNAYLNKKN